MKYIIDKNLNLSNDAGFKARIDIINILSRKGFKYKPIRYERNSLIDIIKLGIDILNLNFEENSEVIIQYPLNYKVIKFLIKKLRKKNCKIICLIHDIETLRMNLDKKRIQEEIDIFDKFDYIISHNNNMTNWLKSNGVKTNIKDLQLFDYICEKDRKKVEYCENKNTISYATGKLGTEKSLYLYDISEILDDKLELILYGNITNNLKKVVDNTSNITYKGSISSDKIVNEIQGRFGLIWDSKNINKCTGMFGNYIKYNNPHKLSMYMAATIPVIVWKQAAIANFVEKNDIGICVESLDELNIRLEEIDDDRYNIMKNNVNIISKKVKHGSYIEDVIDIIEKEIEYCK